MSKRRSSKHINVTIDTSSLCRRCREAVEAAHDRQVADGLPRMTPRQINIARLYLRIERDEGYVPTLDEVGEMLGISKVTVFEHIGIMEARGILTRDKHKQRSITFVPRVREWLERQLQEVA